MQIPLRLLSPKRLVVIGFVIWATLRLTTIFIDYGVHYSWEPVAVVGLYVSAFMAGTVLSGIFPRVVRQYRERFASVGHHNRVALVLCVLSLVFVSLRLFDLLFVRGLLEVGVVQELRNLDNTIVGDERTTGGLGLLSGMGYPIVIPTTLFVAYYRRALAWWTVALAYAVFVLYAVYVVLSGNRYVLVGPVIMIVVARALAERGLRMSLRSQVIACVVMAAGFAFVTFGTFQRDVMFGAQNREAALLVAPDRKLFTASDEFMNWFVAQPAVVQDVTYGYLDIAWYITHGMYEFFKIWDFADPDDRAWGGAQFATALYLLRVLGFDVPSEDVWRRNLPTYGFYTTFFGPVYLDFGVGLGMAYCLFFGMVAQVLWVRALRSDLIGVLLYPYTASVLLGMWSNNYLLAGLGVPIIAMSFVALGVANLFGGRTSWAAAAQPARRSELVVTRQGAAEPSGQGVGAQWAPRNLWER